MEPEATEATPGPRYRVELLIFRHLDSNEEGSIESGLRDFSNALDLLTPPEPVAESEEATRKAPPSELHAADGAQMDAAPLPVEQTGEPPVELVEMQSEAMQHAWRRLRASAGFRPEQFMAWEQAMDEPFPFIRVHDMVVLKEVDPLAGLPADEAVEGVSSPETVVYNDTTNKPEDATEPTGDAGIIDAATQPPPITRFYRIDGSTRLRRSRFLHLDLDIEWREPTGMPAPFPEPASAAAPSATPEATAGADPSASGETYVVHKLSQSRQVQTTRYEYFDGASIAVLALVTRIDPAPTESQPLSPRLGETEGTQP